MEMQYPSSEQTFKGEETYCIKSTAPPAKAWAFFVQNIPTHFEATGVYLNFQTYQHPNLQLDLKELFKFAQMVNSSWSCKTNLGRILAIESESYGECVYQSPSATPVVTGRVDELPDPYQKFLPSNQLIESIGRHMVFPTGKSLELLKELKKIRRPESTKRDLDIANVISGEVEGLLTSLAKKTFSTQDAIPISSNNRFTPEICIELIERLELDAYDPKPVLERLYNELFKFVLRSPRERKWGKIIVDNSELKIILNKNAFSFPDLTKLSEDRWVITP